MNPTIAMIIAEQGAIATRQYPRLGSTLRRLHLAGQLDRPLPGVFTAPGVPDLQTWFRVVSLWSAPTGVLHGQTAAGLWSLAAADPVARLAHPSLRSRRGVQVLRRTVPPEHVTRVGGIRLASPAYAAAELASHDDGRAACEALRLGLATHSDLVAATATLAGTRGHPERVRAIAACEDNPWSYAELRLHRILRSAGIKYWVANRPIRLNGRLLDPDVRFRDRRVIIEVDGRATHQQPGQFELDRERQNEFAIAGYLVIRFTWEQLDNPDYVLRVVREVLRGAPR